MKWFRQLKNWQKGGVIGFGTPIALFIIVWGLLIMSSPHREDMHLVGYIMSSILIVYILPFIILTTVCGIVMGWFFGRFRLKGLIFIFACTGIVFVVVSVILFAAISRPEQYCGQRGICQIPATTNESQVSPSGLYVLEVIDGQDSAHYLQFQIVNTTRQTGDEKVFKTTDIVFSPNDKFYTRHRTYILWDDEVDRVWVYSGDTGLKFWQEFPNPKRWESPGCTLDGNVKVDVPFFLKNVLKQQFQECRAYL